jgi:hypothetical protein
MSHMTRLALLFMLLAATDPRQAMITTLGSENPIPSLGAEAQTFDRLVGTWDTDFIFPKPDGTITHKKGEVRFGWILHGHAVPDTWMTEPSADETERKIGATLRWYDPPAKEWRAVFISPQFNYLVTVHGGAVGDRIVLTGNDSKGNPFRWTFNDIKPDSFVWRGETSYDGGKTWRLEEEHHMTRRKGSHQRLLQSSSSSLRSPAIGKVTRAACRSKSRTQ